MKHPKSDDVLKVIENLRKVAIFASFEDSLDMHKGDITGLPMVFSCGTTHCHGGWYAVAVMPFWKRMSRSVGFSDGAKLMAEHLGFSSQSELQDWARYNPKTWGNPNGDYMFCDESAFLSSKRPKGAKRFIDIIHHWEDVYERLVKLENSESIKKVENTREDITPELAKMPVDETIDAILKHSYENV